MINEMVEEEAEDAVREFDEDFKFFWNRKMEEYERRGDVEMVMRMHDCNAELLYMSLYDHIATMSVEESGRIAELKKNMDDAVALISDVLDVQWISEKKKALSMLMDRMRRYELRLHTESLVDHLRYLLVVKKEVGKRYHMVSKLLMN